jgi:hypothetical protein
MDLSTARSFSSPTSTESPIALGKLLFRPTEHLPLCCQPDTLFTRSQRAPPANELLSGDPKPHQKIE